MGRLLVIGIGVWTAAAGHAALAGPRAGIASTKWELVLDFHDPQRITIATPGESEPVTYWYVVYRVTNRTGQDLQFVPSFRLVTNTFEVVVGGDRVNPAVYNVIAARHRLEFPFFAPPSKITGPLLQGEANSRSSAAVFRTFDPAASSFKLYIGGLSGEIERVPNPAFKRELGETEENPRFFLFRRTLELTYDLPGDEVTRSTATPVRRIREWVMDPMTPLPRGGQ